MKRFLGIGMVTAAAMVSAAVWAQTAAPAKSAAEAKTAIEARQANFKEIKKLYEPLTDTLKGKREFDAALFATNATKIGELAQQIPAKFAVDTRGFKDTKTDALDGIWASQTDFKAKADALVTGANALAAAAKTGDKGATMKAVPAMGKTCGGCHDNYKFKSE
jgi:cytochrome c556